MCFGVRDAIELAQDRARVRPLTVLGDLVHNQTVLDELESQGIRIAQTVSEVSTRDVMVTAHGASERSKANVRALGMNVIEATCPLVHRAHDALARFVATGFHPVIIGKRDHVEVRGMTGDLDGYEVVLEEPDIRRLEPRPRIGIVAQTTQPIGRVQSLVGLIRQRFPDSEVRFADTVCQPTKQRQSAAVQLARNADVVVVVGGANSNNTHELVRTCRRHCSQVHHVQTAADLRPTWFHEIDTVGMTAGTSTPDVLIESVIAKLCGFAPCLHKPLQTLHAS